MSAEYSLFHGLVGCLAVCLAILAHVGPGCTFGVVFVLGLAHETFDNDLFEGGLPWWLPLGYEGWKDALSFLVPGPFLYLLLWSR